jgi:hypothetical protein
MGKNEYTEWCTRNERNGIPWIKAGIWELRELKRGTDNGSCTLYLGKEDIKHALLSCPETMKWKIGFLCKKWHNRNEELMSGKIINCTNRTHVKDTRQYLKQAQMGKRVGGRNKL